MPTFQDVLSAARTLDAAERLRLANTIIDEISPENWPLPDAELIAEAQRRSTVYDQGKTSAVPWGDVRTRARRSAGLDE